MKNTTPESHASTGKKFKEPPKSNWHCRISGRCSCGMSCCSCTENCGSDYCKQKSKAE